MAASALFGLTDICVFLVCALLPLVIGAAVVLRGGSISSTREYFLGGQKQNVLPVVLSLVVSFQSAIYMVGIPAEVYLYGAMYGVRVFGTLLMIPFFVNIAVPLFYSLKLTSINEYFGGRFPATNVRYLMVCGVVFTDMVYGGMVLMGPAIVLQPMIGIPDWAIIITMSLITVAYSTLGGIKAVLWTDVFQCMVMLAGLLAVVIRCTMVAGGPGNVIDIASKYGRLNLFDFNPDPTIRHTFWTLSIGDVFLTLVALFTQQTVQRINSTPSLAQAKCVTLMFIPCWYTFIMLAIACGISAFAYYQTIGCDPIAAGIISNPNEILVITIHDIFQNIPGLTGLFLAALISASLSTVSSILNGLAAITCEDFLKLRWKDTTDQRATALSKIAVVVFGILSTVVALILRFAKGNLAQLCASIMGALTGPTVGIFLLSIFYKKASPIGVYVGALLGFLVSLWLTIGYLFSPNVPQTPWLPLGGTDKCGSYSQSNFTNVLNETLSVEVQNITAVNDSNAVSAQGLDKIYSLSYLYLTVITTLVTAGVGGIVSRMCFSRSGYTVAPDGYVMPIRKVFAFPVKRGCHNAKQTDAVPEDMELQTRPMVET